MVVLAVEASSPFALKLKDSDDLSNVRSRIAKKLHLEGPAAEEFEIRYDWVGVFYALEDEDDWETFQERVRNTNAKEIRVNVSGEALPQQDHEIPHGRRPLNTANGLDNQSLYSTNTTKTTTNPYSYGKYATPGKAHSIHHIASSEHDGTSNKLRSDGASTFSRSTKKSTGGKSTTGTIQTDFSMHSKAFDDFQNSRGVKTFIGSIGPIDNVRMMMKNGHRACYMSREFAQEHNFIPKDAAPGFYGFSGITNLGSWPIKVGEKTIESAVMLVENAFFPVILGRSFMEKRGVRTDPLDPTFVTFMDTGEHIPVDLVIVKDINGKAIPIA